MPLSYESKTRLRTVTARTSPETGGGPLAAPAHLRFDDNYSTGFRNGQHGTSPPRAGGGGSSAGTFGAASSPFRSVMLGRHDYALNTPSPKSHKVNSPSSLSTSMSPPSSRKKGKGEPTLPTYTSLRKKLETINMEREAQEAQLAQKLEQAKQVEANAKNEVSKTKAKLESFTFDVKKLETIHIDVAHAWLRGGCRCEGKGGSGTWEKGEVTLVDDHLVWSVSGGLAACVGLMSRRCRLEVRNLKVTTKNKVCTLQSGNTTLSCRMKNDSDTAALTDCCFRIALNAQGK